jgi:cysteinyl-tRNA synthetase
VRLHGLSHAELSHLLLCCREALKTFSARQLRLMFLLQPWNKPMSYGEQCV